MNTITLYLATDGWMAHFDGPHAASVRALFGTRDIPTPFGTNANPTVVLDAVRVRNPQARVSLHVATVLA